MARTTGSSSWLRWPTVVTAIAAASSLWMGAVQAEPAAGDYFVHSLPGQPEGPLVKMHAGHIEITPEHNGNLFFWHFQNKHIANRQRTIIWLNGGPGCSSEDGALMEVGPYRLKDDHTLVYNEGSWNEFANIMFVDNPVGTGFSYVNTDSYVHELDEMADQFVTFLEKWFKLFPEYEHDDLYLAGESYAGQHIPYIAKHILERNKKPETEHTWELKGLLIGNGWISPADQYEAYIDFAYEKDLIKKDSDIAQKIENQRRICLKDMAGKARDDMPIDVSSCEKILQDILRLTSKQNGNDKDCINMYDVRLTDNYPSCGMNWPPDLKDVVPYLRRNDVVEALHINPNKVTGWEECNGNVGTQFRVHNSKPSISFFPQLLSEVPIVLFSGAEDLICNHLGTETLIGNLEWNGGKGFEVSPGNWAPRREWTFEGKDAGFWQEARNLSYVQFYNSSHMVPFDFPRRTRDMVDRFMGVDISSIGGKPADSRLDGEKGPETTVGGAAGNGTDAQQEEKAKLDAAKWKAYQKSGEIVLVIVSVAAAAWGYFVWRDRRRRAGYRNVAGGGAASATLSSSSDTVHSTGRGGSRLEAFGNRRTNRDLEAGDFDESELDNLHSPSEPDADDRRYSLGEDSEEETEKAKVGQATSSSSSSSSDAKSKGPK